MFPKGDAGKMKEPETMKELHKIREELHDEWKKMSRENVIKSVNKAGNDFEKRQTSIKPV